MNEKETNKEAVPIDITWALVFFLACIVYAILFHGNSSTLMMNSWLG